MSSWREWLSRVGGFFTRADADRVREELRLHRAMLEDEYRARGSSAEDAARSARLDVGGEAQIVESWRDQRSLPALEMLAQDIRYSLRMFARTPAFTCAAILTLALGIGANTAIFTVVDAVLIQPLPYADADRLAMVGEADTNQSAGTVGYATWIDWRDRSRSFEAMSLVRSWAATLVVNGEAELVSGMRVSANFFDLLGANVALGRTFQADEDRPDHWRVLILSDGLWRRRFGADPGVVGRTITISEREYRVIGVMPPGFEPLISARYYQRAEVWAPVGYDLTLPQACRSCRHLMAIGRLRGGTTARQAAAEMTAIHHQLLTEHPVDYKDASIAVEPLRDALAGQVRQPLLVLSGAVGFVLLIACANVAGLLLARSVHRHRELALRSALGAARTRLVRQLVTESCVLSVCGAAAGLMLAYGGMAALLRVAPAVIPRLDRVTIDGRVLLFTGALTAITAVLSGLFPALRESGLGLQQALGDARSSAGGAGRLRSAIVVVELALALVLLAGAGLMIRTVATLVRTDVGFDPARLLTLQFVLAGRTYAERPGLVSFQTRLLERVRALPGVERAAIAGQVPLGGNFDCWGFHARGKIKPNPSEDPCVQRYAVTPDYFATMGIPIIEGRGFNDDDTAQSTPVMVISRTTAARVWRRENPIGGMVRIGGVDGDDNPWRLVVGVSGDVHHKDATETPAPQMYTVQAQNTDASLVLVVKTAADPAALMPSIRAVFKDLDSAVPTFQIATADELVTRAAGDRVFVMKLLAGFAGIAVLLAAVGLYGVVSYGVMQRTREIGLRLALGATPTRIAGLILGNGAALVAAGVIFGLTGAFAALRLLSTLVFGVDVTDPPTVAGAVLLLASVALVAHAVPVIRAMRIDPADALRHE